MYDGILNVNKPAGWTSHDVVGFLRRRLGERRAGHAGTLDPLATGVLLVCLGQATRVAEYLMASRKTYHAIAELGVTTDTYDSDGQIVARARVPRISEDDVKTALARFVGEIEQTPPAYSAIKQQGVPAYRRARRGEQVELSPRRVRIHSIRLMNWEPPRVEFEVESDPGVYIRSLAHDLGQQLGPGATLIALTRTRSGGFSVSHAASPDHIAVAADEGRLLDYLHPLSSALTALTPVMVDHAGLIRLAYGQPIPCILPPPSHEGYALADNGDVAAILVYVADGSVWQPKKVFLTPGDLE